MFWSAGIFFIILVVILKKSGFCQNIPNELYNRQTQLQSVAALCNLGDIASLLWSGFNSTFSLVFTWIIALN